MKVDNSFDLFDMTVTPVALYAVEHWGVLSLPAASFQSKEAILKTWETFQPETVNQKVCRLLLSCHRKSSRLVMLGELGRYPLLIKSLVQTIKYKWSLLNSNHGCNTLVSEALSEMDSLGTDNWLYRVNQIEKLFNLSIHPRIKTADSIGKYVKKKIQSQFDLYWKDEISRKKLDENGIDHNKLRFYSTLKSSFTREPYINNAISRNQRCWISCLRSSSSRLAIELGRYKNIPVESRICSYCSTGEIDDERHILLFCPLFDLKRACFFGKMSSISPSFHNLTCDEKLKYILCPTSEIMCKVVNKFIRIMFNARDNIDEGIETSCYPTYTPPFTFLNCTSFDQFSDSEGDTSLSSSGSSDTSFDSNISRVVH